MLAMTFSCIATSIDGAKQVGLCLSGERITYRFGPDLALPELALERAFSTTTYDPRIAATGTIFEIVTLLNDDTSYEIGTSSRRRIDRDAVTTGSITVTLPAVSVPRYRAKRLHRKDPRG